MLNRQGCHNSGEPITAVPELKRYVRNSKTSYDNLKEQRRRTNTLREMLHDGQMVSRIVGSLGHSYVLRHPRSTCT